MNFELLTGTPSSVKKAALKLVQSNPCWQPVSFGAAADAKGNIKVALGMQLTGDPARRVTDILIPTGEPANVQSAINDLPNPGWKAAFIAPVTAGDKFKVAALVILPQAV